MGLVKYLAHVTLLGLLCGYKWWRSDNGNIVEDVPTDFTGDSITILKIMLT
jgi:hypothetical protein